MLAALQFGDPGLQRSGFGQGGVAGIAGLGQGLAQPGQIASHGLALCLLLLGGDPGPQGGRKPDELRLQCRLSGLVRGQPCRKGQRLGRGGADKQQGDPAAPGEFQMRNGAGQRRQRVAGRPVLAGGRQAPQHDHPPLRHQRNPAASQGPEQGGRQILIHQQKVDAAEVEDIGCPIGIGADQPRERGIMLLVVIAQRLWNLCPGLLRPPLADAEKPGVQTGIAHRLAEGEISHALPDAKADALLRPQGEDQPGQNRKMVAIARRSDLLRLPGPQRRKTLPQLPGGGVPLSCHADSPTGPAGSHGPVSAPRGSPRGPTVCPASA